MKSRSVWQDAVLRLLEGHPVFSRLKGHGSQGVDETGAHRSAEYIRERSDMRIGRMVIFLTSSYSPIFESDFELIVGSDLEGSYDHRAVYERHRASPEGSDSLFSRNTSGGVH